MRSIACALAAFVLAVACSSSSSSGGSPPPLVASDYDQSCTSSSDCTLIQVGDPCGCIGCSFDAINVKDEGKYETDVGARRKACTTEQPCPGLACVCRQAACVANKCAAEACGAGATDAGAD